MIHDDLVRHDIHTYIHLYTYRHQHNQDHKIITKYHKVHVKRTPFMHATHVQH